MSEPIRIFVGCAPNHDDAESQVVLEWSIRKHASRPVEITWMMLSKDPESPFYGWDTAQWVTPFSGLRWAVPELCGFEGRAIYCDSDVIFLDDPAKLFDQEFPPLACVLGAPNARVCVSVWDCARAERRVLSIDAMRRDSTLHGTMYDLFRRSDVQRGVWSGRWNDCDELTPETQCLHYTDMHTQPQLEYAIPRLARAGRKHWFDGSTQRHPNPEVRNLFLGLFAEAAQHGYSVDRYMQHEPFGPIKKRSFAR